MDCCVPIESIGEERLSGKDRKPLKGKSWPGLVIQILNVKHCWIDEMSNLRQQPLEVRKEGRVVESPL